MMLRITDDRDSSLTRHKAAPKSHTHTPARAIVYLPPHEPGVVCMEVLRGVGLSSRDGE